MRGCVQILKKHDKLLQNGAGQQYMQVHARDTLHVPAPLLSCAHAARASGGRTSCAPTCTRLYACVSITHATAHDCRLHAPMFRMH